MDLPSTQPLEGEFWYVLDDGNNVVWKPRPEVRGDFYLGWLGQNKNVVGAGLVQMEQGIMTHICTHGTPYFWLQPYEALPLTVEAIRAQQLSGADTMSSDFSLAGWGMRDQTPPQARQLPEAPIAADDLEPLLSKAVTIIALTFRSEGEPPPQPEVSGLLARTITVTPPDPLDVLLDRLSDAFNQPNVVPILTELVRHDTNVMPDYRESDFFETLSVAEELPPPSKVARLVLSAIYHLAPLLGSRRLNSMLLLNTLRQRHPFDVTWGADFLVKCFGASGLVRLLQAALVREKSDQMRGNILDLLQELGYGMNAGLGDEVLKVLTDLQGREGLAGFGQVVNSHLSFIQEYIRHRDAATPAAG